MIKLRYIDRKKRREEERERQGERERKKDIIEKGYREINKCSFYRIKGRRIDRWIN